MAVKTAGFKKYVSGCHMIFTNSYICYDVAKLLEPSTGFCFVLFSCFIFLYFFLQMTRDRWSQEIVWLVNFFFFFALDIYNQHKALPVLKYSATSVFSVFCDFNLDCNLCPLKWTPEF